MKSIQDFLSEGNNRFIISGGICAVGLVGGVLCATLVFTPFTAVSFAAFIHTLAPFGIVSGYIIENNPSIFLGFIGVAASAAVAITLFTTTALTIPVVFAASAAATITNGLVGCIYNAYRGEYSVSATSLNHALAGCVGLAVGAALIAFTPLNISALIIATLVAAASKLALNNIAVSNETKAIKFISEGISSVFESISASPSAPASAPSATPDII